MAAGYEALHSDDEDSVEDDSSSQQATVLKVNGSNVSQEDQAALEEKTAHVILKLAVKAQFAKVRELQNLPTNSALTLSSACKILCFL